MATYTGTGRIQDIDGSDVASAAVSVRLLNRIVSGGILKTAFAATYTTDGSGNYTLSSLPVPDDATKAAVYGITFPDGRPEIRGAFSSGSSSDVETVLAATTLTVDATTLATALASYLPVSGARAGAVTAAQPFTLGWTAADEISADMTIPSGYHTIRADTSIADGVTVTVAGKMVIL